MHQADSPKCYELLQTLTRICSPGESSVNEKGISNGASSGHPVNNFSFTQTQKPSVKQSSSIIQEK